MVHLSFPRAVEERQRGGLVGAEELRTNVFLSLSGRLEGRACGSRGDVWRGCATEASVREVIDDFLRGREFCKVDHGER